MNLIKYTILITSLLFFLLKNSFACEIDARVSIVGNEFPAIQTVGAGAKKCKGAEVKTNLTADHQKINVAGMSSEPAEYTSAIVANTSIVALLNNDLIRPLDDYVFKRSSYFWTAETSTDGENVSDYDSSGRCETIEKKEYLKLIK